MNDPWQRSLEKRTPGISNQLFFTQGFPALPPASQSVWVTANRLFSWLQMAHAVVPLFPCLTSQVGVLALFWGQISFYGSVMTISSSRFKFYPEKKKAFIFAQAQQNSESWFLWVQLGLCAYSNQALGQSREDRPACDVKMESGQCKPFGVRVEREMALQRKT